MKIIYISAACLMAVSCSKMTNYELKSPDSHLMVKIKQVEGDGLKYSITRDGKVILKDSSIGLTLKTADFTKSLSVNSASETKLVVDDYEMMVGKKKNIHYEANETTYSVKNSQGQVMNVTFRVSNEGVAFRYSVPNPTKANLQFDSEATSFTFTDTTKGWMQPIAEAQTGFGKTNPSYEESYFTNISVGTESPSPAGWVFPALFKTDNTWIALTEVNMDGSFHASRLQANSPKGEYKIGKPMAEEVFTGGNLLAESTGDLTSPWRVLAIGDLTTVMESTLGTDLADKAIPFDKKLIQPGHASWSWAILKDDYTVYDVQKKFIDYAADMHWDYTLIDAEWDKKIGYEKMKELVDYASSKNVGIILWYNSSGDWNTTPFTPKSKLLTHDQRVNEFTRLREMGVKGLKIDFIGGDGRSMIAYYIDILKDAASQGLLINFHGATLPRGWQRTFPNLMTMEAVRGLEFTTFSQSGEDEVPGHVAMLPFTRNLFDPMDFTPMVFGDIPNIKRVTRNGFELAESVLFISGIQHFAEIPEGMATAPNYVKTFLQDLPRSWDDVKFLDGVPGEYAIIARKYGDAWYIAGLNATESDLNISLDLSFLGNRGGNLITDGESERDFIQKELNAAKSTPISIKPHGGFVAVFR